MSETQTKGRLFLYGALEQRDEVDERLEKCHRELGNSIGRLREVELYNHLNDKVNRSQDDHEETNHALLYSILTDPTSASKHYHTLTMVTRDSFNLVITCAERMVLEKMNKLQETSRVQMLWLCREVVQTGVSGADKLVFALLKQLPAGCTTPADIYIVENLMHIVLDNIEWLEKQPGLISSVVYTYLSLLPSHTSSHLTNLRQQEAHMCVTLIRSHFSECCQIGRDVVRLLQGVARIPEISELWKDLLLHPQNLSPQFTGISMLLSRRTSRRFIGGRILMEVEIKLNFLMSKVKFGMHRRYQEWFQKKYLSTPESLHLIPELIRFVCCLIHPSNEVLASDIIPRWALVGWLISLCQNNPVVYANAKLSLFYDWLSYNPDSDNIMNIEPGILLMHHSLRAHPQITGSLLDFLCRMVANFCPSQSSLAENGVKAAFRDILEKGVLLSLDPLFGNPRLDDDLKALLKTTFPEFYQPVPDPSSKTNPSASTEVLEIAAGEGDKVGVASSGDDSEVDYLQGEDSEITSAFSDPEDDMEDMVEGGDEGEPDTATPTSDSSHLGSGDTAEDAEKDGGSSNADEDSGFMTPDPWARVNELPVTLREKMLELRNDNFNSASLLSAILDLIEETGNDEVEGDSPDSVVSVCAVPLGHVLSTGLEAPCVVGVTNEGEGLDEEAEGDKSGEKNAESTDREPQLVDELFRRLTCTQPLAPPISSLALSLHSQQPKFGLVFLYYLHYCHTHNSDDPAHSDTTKDYFTPYQQLLSKKEGVTFEESLFADLKVCVEEESSVFFKLLPVLCQQMSSMLVGSHQLISLIVTHIDPSQLNSLMYDLLNKKLQLFGRQSFNIDEVLKHSLDWESFEQFCVWQLLGAEGPDPSLVIPSLANMDNNANPEALSGALLYLKNESSGYSSIGPLFSLPLSHTPLVEVIGGRWVGGRPTKSSKFLSQFLEGLEKKSPDEFPVAEVHHIYQHLYKVIQLLSSRIVLDASESALSKTLVKQFKSYPDLASKYGDLYKLCQQHPQQSVSESSSAPGGKKDSNSSGHKRQAPSSSSASATDKSSSKHEPKAKKRRVTNKDDIIVLP